MLDVALVRQAVDPEKVDRLREWTDEILDRRAEALTSMDAEGMHAEGAFLRETEDGVYLYAYVEADDVEAALATYAESDRDIDEDHREVMDEVVIDSDGLGEFEPLYRLRTD